MTLGEAREVASTRRHRERTGRALTGLLAALVMACGTSAPPSARQATVPPSAASPTPAGPTGTPAGPTGTPVLGLDWGRAASVARPGNFGVDPAASAYTGTHPILRIPGQAMMADVAAMRRGFVAVGYVPSDWVPASWTSDDGQSWSIHSMDTTDFTFPVSLATGRDGIVVAVGRSREHPMAWTSADGQRWQRHNVPVGAVGGPPERMTVVAAGPRGFVAGGSVGPELSDRRARFWTSPDGAAWSLASDDSSAFANAEVRAITASTAGFVAVGVVGSAQAPTAAVAWTSPDGAHWTRVDASSFVGGVAVALTEGPSGGIVAVGSDLGRREALVWTSADGEAWTRAPTEPSRLRPGQYVWMTDVVAIGRELIAIGEIQGLQRGTGAAWVSDDGIAWTLSRTAPVQEQGEFYAVVPGGPGAIVVGSFGAPDSYVPSVWLSPAR